jgi:hypothetical protein
LAYPGDIFARDLYRARRGVGEANLLILSDLSGGIDVAMQTVTAHMAELRRYIELNPTYRLALLPLDTDEASTPRVASLAAAAAASAGVGPMAAIPGALADLAVGAMREFGCSVSVVENGGEISAVSDRPILVAIYAGWSQVSGKFGLFLEKGDTPIGIATSSATVSHALSFGEADAAVIVSGTAATADAAATRVCNVVRGADIEASVAEGLRTAERLPGVRGAIVIRGSIVGTMGHLPRIVPLHGRVEEIFETCLLEPNIRP